jgi:Domain of Unknown Function (DUF1080)
MKKHILWALLCAASLLHAQAPKMIKIFNGKNLAGWKAPEGNIWWSAGRGQLLAQSSVDKKGTILWTEKSYTNFVVQLDFKMGDGVIDSGVFLRSDNDQVQIGISGSLKRDMTGSPYIPGLRYPVEAKGVQALLKLKDWNQLKIKVVDKTYTAWLNGVEVMTYTSEKIPATGPIGLQLHPGNEMSIRFRRIMVAEF